ncbi:hypothetical protein PUN28_004082 [Cardiocondyla obscurior]|uniref:Uncharacterized protein n=1 Tax=Cardiocondyla obscurior TaxID=286306 RepID=A0AAW2GPF5_9HYME
MRLVEPGESLINTIITRIILFRFSNERLLRPLWHISISIPASLVRFATVPVTQKRRNIYFVDIIKNNILKNLFYIDLCFQY